jgi:hypothetical protein
MTNTSKLWLIPTLALAALAVMAAPAFAAATFAETGAWIASENGAGTLSNNAISITCQTSTATGTAQNIGTDGGVTVDTLTFGSCRETITGQDCTVTVNNLPDSFTVTHNAAGPHTGSMTSDGTSLPFGSATVHCGDSLTCTATSDTTLTVEAYNSAGSVRGIFEITSEGIVIGGDTGCGLVVEGSWNSAWTIDQTSGQNNTGTGSTVVYTDTTFTITA